jgi:hypothetical protein
VVRLEFEERLIDSERIGIVDGGRRVMIVGVVVVVVVVRRL